jgi:MoaA/NifB/PqqE/SkfB family radical SAM enzyme
MNTSKTIVVETNYTCDLDCVHCYVPLDEKTKNVFLPLPMAERIFKEIYDLGFRNILLTGGEPLLHPYFIDIYLAAYRNNLKVSVFTNGVKLETKIIELFKKYPPALLRVSFFGGSKRSYKEVTGRDLHKRVKDNLIKLKEEGINMRVKIPLLKQNYKDIDSARDFLKELGVSNKVDVRIIPRFNKAADTIKYRLSPGKIVNLGLDNELRNKEKFKYIRLQPKNKVINHFTIKDCLEKCQPFMVNPNSELQLCFFIRNFKVNLQDFSFLSAIEQLNEKIGQYINDTSGDNADKGKECFSCNRKNICPYCPGWARNETGSENKPIRFLCELTNLYWQKYDDENK